MASVSGLAAKIREYSFPTLSRGLGAAEGANGIHLTKDQIEKLDSKIKTALTDTFKAGSDHGKKEASVGMWSFVSALTAASLTAFVVWYVMHRKTHRLRAQLAAQTPQSQQYQQ